jgi:MinD superfamily P-loop ATPase
MIVTVASGKGGTGKTTLAVNLAVLADRLGKPVHLCDCDVEEPNAHLFLDLQLDPPEAVCLPLPVVDPDLCRHCGVCAEICEFNAIACLPRRTVVFPELCHSCSGCWLVCPEQAISQGARLLGLVQGGVSGGLGFTRGQLEVGQTLVPPLIEAVNGAPRGPGLVFRDAPPGTTCPTVAALEGSDFVVLVTEPTPFGLHDLEAAVELVHRLNLPCAVVVNRLGIGDGRVQRYCAEVGIPLLPAIPYSREAAEVVSRGELVIDGVPELQEIFRDLLEQILDHTREAIA